MGRPCHPGRDRRRRDLARTVRHPRAPPPQPIMPLRLFSSRERSGAYAARLLFLGAMAPFWFFTTQWLQSVAGYTPVQAGLAFLPVTLPNFAAAMAIPASLVVTATRPC